MKSILAILTLLTALFVIAPSAEAYDGCNRRIVSYTSCGRPIYATYQFYGYDRCGNPVGRWVTESSRCSCSVCNPRPVYSYPSYPRYPSYSGGYNRGGGSCDNHHHRSGFYFSFGR
ncbi:MAG: hypothetical protein JNM99_07610 [Verrucomicrobiaceae bacterium]|nr:hypothetical protein [Verrucomicrobiaceae bacterium]